MYRVLVIDNISSAAKKFAKLIETKTGFETISASSLKEAVEILMTNTIKVVVLDQKMPEMSGTEMYTALKSIDSKIKVMMFSGQAETNDWVQATRLGYDDYLEKGKLEQLPERVQELLTKYEVDQAHFQEFSPGAVLVERKVGMWPFLNAVKYVLLDVTVVKEDFVFEDSWQTVRQIHAGETAKHMISLSREKSIKIDASSEAKLTSELGLSADNMIKMSAKLSEELTRKETASVSRSNTSRLELTRELKLPEAPADPAVNHVASRHYQEARVYSMLRVLLLKKCSCCDSSETLVVKVFRPTTKVATRHKDFWNDQSEHIVPTGVERF